MDGSVHVYVVHHPYWSLALFTIAPAVLVLRSRGKRRRLLPGLCQSCGYDLRASPDRCPECGEAVHPGPIA